ncbi:hypothetical protein NL476_28035, partial [Klebsiella pneumoniae]|nr:hypothetical protein [Klebsiella pneumoniae]
TVVASEAEQPDRNKLGQQNPLHRLPRMFKDEVQLPTGDGLPPPSEPSLPGMEAALPALREADDREPMDDAQPVGTVASRLLNR